MQITIRNAQPGEDVYKRQLSEHLFPRLFLWLFLYDFYGDHLIRLGDDAFCFCIGFDLTEYLSLIHI